MSETAAKNEWIKDAEVSKSLCLMARRIRPSVFETPINVCHVSFGEELRRSLTDLAVAANDHSKQNLPIRRLRAALIHGLDELVVLDPYLGTRSHDDRGMPFIVYEPMNEDLSAYAERIQGLVSQWVSDVVLGWATSQGLDPAAERLFKAIGRAHQVVVTPSECVPNDGFSSPATMPLLVRELAQPLIQQNVFRLDDTRQLPGVELVAAAEPNSNSVELMTRPLAVEGLSHLFSMVLRLTVQTAPFGRRPYLKVSVGKRVWSNKVPGYKPNAPMQITGYVFSPNRPIAPVGIERRPVDGKWAWQFADDYAPVRFAAQEDGGELPALLDEAVKNRSEHGFGWWVGLPQVPRLFDSLAPRTAFESDEVEALENVEVLLGDLLEGRVEYRQHSLRPPARTRTIPVKRAQLTWSVTGLQEDEEDLDEEAAEPESLVEQRSRFQEGLRLIHGDKKPVLWFFGGSEDERNLFEQTADKLLGNDIEIRFELLPDKTHGLAQEIGDAKQGAIARLNNRTEAWKAPAEGINQIQGRPKYVVICAAKDVNRKPEDPVNYWAGMHAMCAMADANVHHLLPIDKSSKDPEQHYIHRVQSALLDVIFAHAGIVIGSAELLQRCYPEGRAPNYVYGFTTLRKGYARGGENPITLFVSTRLNTATQLTEVQFIYPKNKGRETSAWMPLTAGLRWLGANRALAGQGGQPWLKTHFQETLREQIVEIIETDPKALLMIDWRNASSLKTGLSNKDLDRAMHAGKSLTIADLDLAKVAQDLSVVRVGAPAGHEPPNLRTIINTRYIRRSADRLRRSATDQKTDIYATTRQALIELEPAGGYSEEHGHFIGVFGYGGGNPGLARGISGYRNVVRLSRVSSIDESEDQKKATVFALKNLTPATKESAIPTAQQVTVLHCPAGISPCVLAMTTFGLRVGYLHFGDWTTVPAPLFFRRKIEDYAIPYAPRSQRRTVAEDEAEIGVIDEVCEPAAEPSLSEGPQSAVANEILNKRSEAAPSDAEEEPSPPPERVTRTPADWDTPMSDDEILRAVQKCRPPIFPQENPHLSRTACASRTRGRFRVPLPPFTGGANVFKDVPPMPRRMLNRMWQKMRQNGMALRAKRQPSSEEFYHSLPDRLAIPQSGYWYLQVMPVSSNMPLFPEVSNLATRYHEEIRSSEGADWAIDDVEGLLAWIHDNNNDAGLAWLLVYAAQFPAVAGLQKIGEYLQRIEGPLSREAALYFLMSAAAVEAYLANAGKKDLPDWTLEVPAWARSETPGMPSDEDPVSAEEDKPEPSATGPAPDDSGTTPSASKPPAPSDLNALKTEFEDLDRRLRQASADLIALPLEATAFQDRVDGLMADLQALREDRSTLQSRTEEFFEQRQREQDQSRAEAEQEAERRRQDVAEQAKEAERARQAAEQARRGRLLGLREQALGLCDAIQAAGWPYEDYPAPIDDPLSDEEMEVADHSLRAIRQLLRDREENRTNLRAVHQQQHELLESQDFSAVGDLARQFSRLSEEANAIDDRLRLACDHCPLLIFGDCGKQTVADTPAESPQSSPGDAQGVAAPAEDAGEQARAPEAGETAPPAAEEPSVDASEVNDDAVEATRQEDLELDGRPIDEAEAESPIWGASYASRQFETLTALFNQRLYELAALHLDAVEELATEERVGLHPVALRRMARALITMDCNNSVFVDPYEPLHADSDQVQSFLNGDEHCQGPWITSGLFACHLLAAISNDSNQRWDLVDVLGTRPLISPALDQLLEYLTGQGSGLNATREQLARARVGHDKANQNAIARMRERATHWPQDPELKGRAKHHAGYANIFHYILSPKYELGRVLKWIAEAKDSRLLKYVSESKNKIYKVSASTIAAEAAKKSGERKKLDGWIRHALVENIETTQEFIKTYVETLSQSKSERDSQSNLDAFVCRVHELVEETLADIQAQEARNTLEGTYKTATVGLLKVALRIFNEQACTPCISAEKQKLLVRLPLDLDLRPRFTGDRRLTSPQQVLEELADLASEELDPEDGSEDRGLNHALKTTVDTHVSEGRLYPAYRIVPLLPTSVLGEGARTQLMSQLHQAHKDEQQSLSNEVIKVQQRVGNALATQAITLKDAERYYSIAHDIRAANSPGSQNRSGAIGAERCEHKDFPDFEFARHVLAQFGLELDASLESSISVLLVSLQQLEEEQGAAVKKDAARVRRLVSDENKSFSNLRAAQDALTRLQHGQKLPEIDEEPLIPIVYDNDVRALKAAAGNNESFLLGLKHRLERPADEADPEIFAHLNDSDRREAAAFIDQWLGLFEGGPSGHDLAGPMKAFFASVGIDEDIFIDATGAKSSSKFTHFFFDRSPFRELNAEALETFIPPELGSAAHNISIVLMGSREGTGSIRGIAARECNAPTFVLCHRSMNLQTRNKVAGDSKALIVDDDLIAYMATAPHQRAQRLLQISLLTANLNPYQDLPSGAPTEMFFGRQKEMDQLQSVKGIGVLYGGRRLGKTSLFTKLQHQAEVSQKQGKKIRVIYVSMDNMRASEDYVCDAWLRIYKQLDSMNLLPEKTRAIDSSGALKNAVEGAFRNADFKGFDFMLLLDEADQLVERESATKDPAQFTRQLQQIIDNLPKDRSVRFVIAGLHNVARMLVDENSVLGKAQNPISVGPFNSPEEIRSGIDLICKPLAALGYYFEDQELPFRILSFCHFYPAFVQLYAHELIKRLQNEREKAVFPTYITASILDEVERSEELFQNIQYKYKLNLRLDLRYRAIVLLLALEFYLSQRGDATDEMHADLLHEMCREYFPQHFESIDSSVFVAYLDEMRRLNILKRADNRWSLAHPNVAVTIGDEDAVESEIEQLRRTEPVHSRSRAERLIHIQQSNGPKTLFPMPVGWVRSIADALPGTGRLVILAGNALSGIRTLSQKVDKTVKGEWVFDGLPGPVTYLAYRFRDSKKALRHLEHMRVDAGRRISRTARTLPKRLLGIPSDSWDIQDIHKFASIAEQLGELGIQLILLADATKALDLAKSSAYRNRDENTNWSVTAIPPWSDDTLFFAAGEHGELMESVEIRDRLTHSTCRFGDLLEHITRNADSQRELEKHLSEADAQFGDTPETFYRRIGIPETVLADDLATIRDNLNLTHQQDTLATLRGVLEGAGLEGWTDYLQWMGLVSVRGEEQYVHVPARLLKAIEPQAS